MSFRHLGKSSNFFLNVDLLFKQGGRILVDVNNLGNAFEMLLGEQSSLSGELAELGLNRLELFLSCTKTQRAAVS